MSKDISKLHASLAQVFANPIRIEIIEALIEGVSTTDALARYTCSTKANISQHLKMMRDRGVVRSDRNGLSVRHSLNIPQLATLFRLERELVKTIFANGDEVDRSVGNDL